MGKGWLVREENTPGEWRSVGGQAGRSQGDHKVLSEAGEMISQDQSKPLIGTEQKTDFRKTSEDANVQHFPVWFLLFVLAGSCLPLSLQSFPKAIWK